ncbi:MAG: hypothetical protein RLY93_20080 [Sumerlaeia bacterium]
MNSEELSATDVVKLVESLIGRVAQIDGERETGEFGHYLHQLPISQRALDPLIAGLSHESRTVRHFCARALGRLADPFETPTLGRAAVAPAVPALMDRLRREAPPVESKFVYLTALATLGSYAREAMPLLRELMTWWPRPERLLIAVAMAEIADKSDPQALDSIVGVAVSETSSHNQARLIEALYRLRFGRWPKEMEREMESGEAAEAQAGS